MFTILQPSIVIHQAQLPHNDSAQGQVNQRPLSTGTPESTDHYLECTSIYTGKCTKSEEGNERREVQCTNPHPKDYGCSCPSVFTDCLLIECLSIECMRTTITNQYIVLKDFDF